MLHLRLRAADLFREALAPTARVDFRWGAARRAVCFLVCVGGVLAFVCPGDGLRRAKTVSRVVMR